MEQQPETADDVLTRDLDFICGRLAGEFERLAGKDVLITGGGGFLGYYLTQAPLHWNRGQPENRHIRVTVYDNFSRGRPAWLEALREHHALSLVQHDIVTPLPGDMPDFRYIVHAASIASPTYYRQHPIATMDANVTGLRQLLEYCKGRPREAPVEGFLFFSSSEVYGDPDPAWIPTPETYHGSVSCTGPRACYDESKRYGETLCVNFARQYGLPIRIVRPFNNYGPGLKISDRRVLPDFARDVLAGRPIVLLSDGSPTRTFCYVADAVVGYYQAIVHGGRGEAYNIGVEEPEVSMADLAELVANTARELFGYTGNVVRQASGDDQYLVDNPNRRCPVIDKARTELNYAPSIALADGLRRSLLWYRDNREGEDA